MGREECRRCVQAVTRHNTPANLRLGNDDYLKLGSLLTSMGTYCFQWDEQRLKDYFSQGPNVWDSCSGHVQEVLNVGDLTYFA